MLFSFYDAVDWGNARLQDAVGFLRSIPSLLAPKPSAQGAPYTLPFTGGQIYNIRYLVGYSYKNWQGNTITGIRVALGAIVGMEKDANGWSGIRSKSGENFASIESPSMMFQGNYDVSEWRIVSVSREDGQPDSPINLPNPNPAPNINDDGLFSPNNPVIGDENGTLNSAAIILSPAAPLILIGGGLAAAAAAAAAAQATSDALAAIKKVAESLDALKKLWEKLQEFLEEWEKDRPKNRDIVRQTYGSIEGDGAIDFYPLSNKNFTAIQVDIVVTEVPLGFGKYFGSMSPSRYRYKELGYISFYSINKGIIETHSIQFKRSSLAIPKIAVGFIYHFGLDNKIKGFAFGTFSVRKT